MRGGGEGEWKKTESGVRAYAALFKRDQRGIATLVIVRTKARAVGVLWAAAP